jgi:hypothetical protein
VDDQVDPFARAAQELAELTEAHEEHRDSAAFKAQGIYLDRITQSFAFALRLSHFAFTRYPEAGKWLQQRFADDFLESAVSVAMLAKEGVFNSPRRELRYMLEAAVKYVYVDQQVPGEASTDDRLALLRDTKQVPRSSINPIDDTTIRMLNEPDAFRHAVRSAFGVLSGYVHLSERQLKERLVRTERGEFSGFESAKTLEAFNRLVFQTYDLVLVLLFEGIGPSFTGDIFIQALDDEPDWKFHKGRFMSRVGKHFDYKLERQRPQA